MLIVGFIIKAKTELVWYGCEISAARKKELTEQYRTVKKMQIIETYDDFFSGLMIGNPERINPRDLEIKYYFPEEEDPGRIGADRIVDLTKVKVISRRPGRKRCDPGFFYICGGEYIENSIQLKHYATGFLPPFKPEDIVLFVDDLTDFGYPGSIMAEMTYQGKTASYSESEIILDRSFNTRILAE